MLTALNLLAGPAPISQHALFDLYIEHEPRLTFEFHEFQFLASDLELETLDVLITGTEDREELGWGTRTLRVVKLDL